MNLLMSLVTLAASAVARFGFASVPDLAAHIPEMAALAVFAMAVAGEALHSGTAQGGSWRPVMGAFACVLIGHVSSLLGAAGGELTSHSAPEKQRAQQLHQRHNLPPRRPCQSERQHDEGISCAEAEGQSPAAICALTISRHLETSSWPSGRSCCVTAMCGLCAERDVALP